MILHSHKEFIQFAKISRVVASCLEHMALSMKVGMTTVELDEIGRAFLKVHGARSAPEVMYQFPGATCISINEQAAHGVPGNLKIRAGDVVNIDVSAELDGVYGDTGGTFLVPPVSLVNLKLCETTKRARDEAIAKLRAGSPVATIGDTIQEIADQNKYQIIANLGSHGIGKKLHEAPEFIPGFRDPNEKRILKKHSLITVEPFLAIVPRAKSKHVVAQEADDGWTLNLAPGSRSAQYEHTVLILESGSLSLTDLSLTLEQLVQKSPFVS